MATDYDAPRREVEETDEHLAAVTTSVTAREQSPVDADEANLNEDLELPGADLSGESLAVRVVPVGSDEFTCARCFLVHHVSQRAGGSGAAPVCTDCDG